MRMIFSLLGLLVVVAIVGILTKKQLSTVTQLPNQLPNSATSNARPATPGNSAEQRKQIQEQVKDQLNEAMKAAAEGQQKAIESGSGEKPAEKMGSAY